MAQDEKSAERLNIVLLSGTGICCCEGDDCLG